MRHLPLLALLIATAALPAMAQDIDDLNDRVQKLERDIGATRAGAQGGAPINNGQMQVRLSQIDEEFRQIRGLIEQVQFQNRQAATDHKKFVEDVDYRLRAIEQKQAAAVVVPAPAPEAPAAATATADAPMDDATGAAAVEAKPATYKPETAKPALTGKDFPNANAHYSYAFKLLNEKKYSDAAASFDMFVKRYPTDPLASNAYYWLGESQYVRSDFTRSAESFRKGFEVNPEGQKAPDNLYKLAMSLNQIKRKSEACIVLSQVISKYGESSARTAAKAQEARTTLQCK